MEFFERAHVVKSDNFARKDNKSEEKTKNQLKKMLYGYRNSDNTLIKDSAEEKIDFDDSSSVSGYSDLNITNSTCEGEVTQATESSEQNHESIDDKNYDSQDISTDAILDNLNDSLSVESISEYEENIKSLSEDISHEELKAELSEDINEESLADSFIETSTDVDSNTDNEYEFDPDGSLAAKIFEKLSETKKVSIKERKSRKRKLIETDQEIEKEPATKTEFKGPYRPQEEDVIMDNLSTGMSNINIPEHKLFKGPYRPKSLESSEDSEVLDDEISQNGSFADSIDLSSPFVSVVATDMPSESLNDILGEYRHPTIRNLPSDTQHTLSTNNSGLFETENVSVVDIQTEEDISNSTPEVDVCSIIPEVEDVPLIEDIDLDSSEFEASIEAVEDSTAYDTTLQSEEVSEREPSTDCVDGLLVNPVKIYYCKNNTCIFILKHPIEIYIHGKVTVKKLGGNVEILGYTLSDEPCDVYAPNYNHAQYLRTMENPNAYYGLFGKLTSLGLPISEVEDVVTTLGEHDSVVLMRPLKSRQMEFVENNFTTTDLFSKTNKNIDSCFKKASEMLGCSLYLSRPWKSFEEHVSWKQAIKSGLNPQSRGIVCGGKGTGKSTFLRYYVNKLLGSGPVLVLDLDPGQCEFTPAGNVSATVVGEPLLGPNFTHLKTPEMMLNIGMINTMDNSRRYAAAVEALITHCHGEESLRKLPWIVNTMGMTNAMGLKFMSLIILQAQPTFLLQIDSKNFKKRYDFHLYPQTIKNLYFEDYQNDPLFWNVKEVNVDYSFFLAHHSDSQVKNNFSLAPREERYLNFLAYFGEMLNTRRGDLLDIVPYEVNLKDLKIGLNVKIGAEAVAKVLNGKIVALCQQGDNGDGHLFTLSNKPLHCLALGLIRGVDWEKGVLYMITPAAGARLAAADTLAYADWAPELRLAPRGLPAGQLLPYRTAAHYNQRRFMFTPKRRFNPLQLLKMSRSA